jgi:hypothetical protein
LSPHLLPVPVFESVFFGNIPVNMKTFIVAALLVAAVAGQSTMDILKLNKEKSLLTKFDRPSYPMIHDYERNNMIDSMSTHKFTGEFDYDTTTIYQIDEIMSHPLFREYMSLPIFRQYWEYPMFQRYVASIYFQRFWQIPTFQQYFMSPALFYKYIFPMVQLFKYEATTMNTYTGGDWIWNKDTYNTYPYNSYPYNTYNTGSDYYGQQEMVNKNIPTMCHYNSVYCQALLEKMYSHMQMMMTYGQEDMHMQMPYEPTTYSKMYNPYTTRMMEGYYNRYPSTFETTEKMTPYMFNKERMYNNVHFNKDMYMNTYETPKMIDEIMTTPTGVRFEKIHPTYNYNRMGVQTFDKKFMPLIKA